MTSATIGNPTNNLSEVYTYSTDGRLQLANQRVVNSGTDLMNLSYDYQAQAGSSGAGTQAGNSGQLIAVTATISGAQKNQSYSYDTVGRLKSASGWGGWTQTYSYDRWGNRTGVSGTTEVQQLGYSGSYPVLLRYIRPWRQAAQAAVCPTARFETDPGQQAQLDWGSTTVYFDAGPRRVHLFIMVLGYSRRIFVKAYFNERMDSLLDGHASAFSHFGGRTRSILYDNPRTIVLDKDEQSGQVSFNATFKDRMDFYGVELKLCRYYRAQTKGKVESGVNYVKRNALVGRSFRDLDHLNEWLLEWCVEIAGPAHPPQHTRAPG